MRVLIACEFSGVVREAFAKRGHDAWSVDIIPTDQPGNHYTGDVRSYLYNYEWDLMIAHPPCTYLARSGARWLKEPGRRELMLDAVSLFRTILDAPVPRIAVENPRMMLEPRRLIGADPDQVIQPWQFGHPESKATCLWLKNLPQLEPTNIVQDEFERRRREDPRLAHRIHHMSPSPDRGRKRSITYTGIAEAMAEQWGNL